MPNPKRSAPVSRVANFTSAALLMGISAVKPDPAWAGDLPGFFSGDARTVSATGLLSNDAAHLALAPTAICPCDGTVGKAHGSTVPGLTLGTNGAILMTGTTTAQVLTSRTRKAASVDDTSIVSGLSLLGGLITADRIEADAEVAATPTSVTPSTAKSEFTNLIIAGTTVPSTVPENTVYTLPGLGSVTLNTTHHRQSSLAAVAGVDMLRVVVTQSNALGLAVGTTLTVGQATAAFDRRQPPAALGGSAYGFHVSGDNGSALQQISADGASLALPGCTGTNNEPVTRSSSALAVPGLLSLGTLTTSVSGGTTGSKSTSTTTATVENLSLLNGLITATGIISAAQESFDGITSTGSSTGTSFGGLSVASVPVPTAVPANTQIALPGLGYVVVNEQSSGSSSLKVTGLHVVITTANLLGLPIGTNLMIAEASASARKF